MDHSQKTSLYADYTDPRAPGSFSGLRTLMRYGGRSKHETKEYLACRDA